MRRAAPRKLGETSEFLPTFAAKTGNNIKVEPTGNGAIGTQLLMGAAFCLLREIAGVFHFN